MSLENAILEHAAAVREMAAAIRDAVNVGARLVSVQPSIASLYGTGEALEKAKDVAEAKAAAEAHKEAPDAKAAAIAEAKAAAAAHKEEKQAEVEQKLAAKVAEAERAAADGAETVALDYAKDVKPVLLELNKAKGRDALAGLLGEFGAKTGDKLTGDQLPAVLAKAQALIAG